jgi:hypothetical protein
MGRSKEMKETMWNKQTIGEQKETKNNGRTKGNEDQRK